MKNIDKMEKMENDSNIRIHDENILSNLFIREHH